MKPAFSQTAQAVALARATEALRPRSDRLFQDECSIRLLHPGWRVVLPLLRVPLLGAALLAFRERQFPGVLGNLLCRTRYIDDALENALASGCGQVVILGAGLDCRAYRMPAMARVHVFEVDRPEMVAWKQACVRRALGGMPGQVSFVASDFNRGALRRDLHAAGYVASVNTFFVCEGLTQYLTAEAVDDLFHCAAEAVSGSQLVFTYIDQGVIDGTCRSAEDERLLSYVRRLDSPWLFGITAACVTDYLAARGLRLVDDVGAAEYRVRYLNPRRRALRLYEKERCALAEVMASRERC